MCCCVVHVYVRGGSHTFTSSSRISTLSNKVLDYSMEYSVVVLAFKTQLHKVPNSPGCLLCPQLNIHISKGGLEEHLALGGRFCDVYGGHVVSPLRRTRSRAYYEEKLEYIFPKLVVLSLAHAHGRAALVIKKI